MNSLPYIQNLIGYNFKDVKLLDNAFTHSSYVNEHLGLANERMEFLGDCVLNFLVGEKLYFKNPTAGEGKLSSTRASLVSREPLARIVDDNHLIDYLKVGNGVDKSKFSVKARSDIFEALLGAVYIDGGLSACETMLNNIFYCNVMPEQDYKSKLQEFAVKNNLSINYETKQDGTDFNTVVTIGNSQFFGIGTTKHSSQIEAARSAIINLQK